MTTSICNTNNPVVLRAVMVNADLEDLVKMCGAAEEVSDVVGVV
jgi:hypothetical protein